MSRKKNETVFSLTVEGGLEKYFRIAPKMPAPTASLKVQRSFARSLKRMFPEIEITLQSKVFKHGTQYTRDIDPFYGMENETQYE